MKKTIVILLALVLVFSLTGCNSNAIKLSVEKTINYLGKPITSFPYYDLEDTDDYEIRHSQTATSSGSNDINTLGLRIKFTGTQFSTGFLGVENHKVDSIYVNCKDVNDKSKITEIRFYYYDYNEEYLDKILRKNIENEWKNPQSGKKITFGESSDSTCYTVTFTLY